MKIWAAFERLTSVDLNANFAELVAGALTSAAPQIAPAALTADTNNWNPAGLATAKLIEVAQTGGPWKITGIAAQAAGRRLLMYNATGGTLTLRSLNANSIAANQILCPSNADLVIPAFGVRALVYLAAGKWLVEGAVA